MQLISTEYVYPNRKRHTKDKLILILKKSNGEKVRKTVKGTKITYYVSKPEYWDERMSVDIPTEKYIPKDKVYPVTCLFEDLYRNIVDELDDNKLRSYFRTSVTSGEQVRKKLSKIHLDNRLHGTDIFIDDYYINKYLTKNPYEENMFGLTKSFLDIEVDSSEIQGFPEPDVATEPINAISYVDDANKVINSYLLEYPDLKKFRKFKKNVKSFIKRIEEKYNNEYKVNIYFFKEEIDLIQSLFDYINETKPDFNSAWNGDFDYRYISNRIVTLGYEPREIMCPEDIPLDEKKVDIRPDERATDPADKHSIYNIAGFTNYIDEMSLYANITKPFGKKESYSLDFIAEEETGLRKEEVEGNMKFFHLIDYEKFVEYNIHDSYVLGKIESKTNHIDLLYTLSMITRTKIENTLKKTVSINNMARYFAAEKGLIKSNNRSALYTRPDKKIPGAFVAPINNIDYVGMLIDTLLSKLIFECVTDLDLAALYPSIYRAFNISLDAFIGYLDMHTAVGDGEDFIQDYITGDIVNIGRKYFNLPGIDRIHEIATSKSMKKVG